MKTKIILIGILSLVTFATFAQNKSNETSITKSAVAFLKFETNKLSELKEFDWDKVEEMFEDNDDNQNITLAFEFANNSEADESSIVINNFKMEFKGKSSDLKAFIENSKTQIQRLVELNDTYED